MRVRVCGTVLCSFDAKVARFLRSCLELIDIRNELMSYYSAVWKKRAQAPSALDVPAQTRVSFTSELEMMSMMLAVVPLRLPTDGPVPLLVRTASSYISVF